MNLYISVNGVLRNFIQKLVYHYQEEYLNSEIEGNTFEYGINEPILNNKLLESFKFSSKEELEYFLYIDFPIEIFGHAGLSYSNCFTELNKLIYEKDKINVTLVSLDEIGKAKPATLFFLSKNGFLGSNIKFIKSENLKKEWKNCDIWITDDKNVLDTCPNNKLAIKFNTIYNQHFTNNMEISKLSEISDLCSKYLEKTTTSTLTQLPANVEQEKSMKTTKMMKLLK